MNAKENKEKAEVVFSAIEKTLAAGIAAGKNPPPYAAAVMAEIAKIRGESDYWWSTIGAMSMAGHLRGVAARNQ